MLTQEDEELFSCFICFNLLEDTFLLPCCAKYACYRCLVNWFEGEEQQSCPHCRSSMALDKMVACPFMDKALQHLEKIKLQDPLLKPEPETCTRQVLDNLIFCKECEACFSTTVQESTNPFHDAATHHVEPLSTCANQCRLALVDQVSLSMRQLENIYQYSIDDLELFSNPLGHVNKYFECLDASYLRAKREYLSYFEKQRILISSTVAFLPSTIQTSRLFTQRANLFYPSMFIPTDHTICVIDQLKSWESCQRYLLDRIKLCWSAITDLSDHEIVLVFSSMSKALEESKINIESKMNMCQSLRQLPADRLTPPVNTFTLRIKYDGERCADGYENVNDEVENGSESDYGSGDASYTNANYLNISYANTNYAAANYHTATYADNNHNDKPTNQPWTTAPFKIFNTEFILSGSWLSPALIKIQVKIVGNIDVANCANYIVEFEIASPHASTAKSEYPTFSVLPWTLADSPQIQTILATGDRDCNEMIEVKVSIRSVDYYDYFCELKRYLSSSGATMADLLAPTIQRLSIE